MSSGELVVGLMSGTSLDGIDAALVRFEGSSPEDFAWTLLAFESTPYEPDRQALLLKGMTAQYLLRRAYRIGKIGTSILIFLTLGVTGLWTIVDLVKIVIDSFKDK